MDEACDRHKLHLAARLRWLRPWAIIRDKVLAGELRAEALLPHGEVKHPTIAEWQTCWPKAGETRAVVQYQGMQLPARVLLVVSDIDRAFNIASKAPATREAVRQKVRAELKRLQNANQLPHSMRATAALLARFATTIEDNADRHYTVAESIRTNQDLIALYKSLCDELC